MLARFILALAWGFVLEKQLLRLRLRLRLKEMVDDL